MRPGHSANDGRIFAWDDPPPTGNPGDDFGCRCTAETFDPNAAEYLSIELGDVSDSGPQWTSRDFVRHYFQGRGRTVTVRETGHLVSIARRHLETVVQSLQDNIARRARETLEGAFADEFINSYNMKGLGSGLTTNR